MDIFFNSNPRFTKWLAKSNALHEPFVLVDVGVLGGENPRWHFLGDYLIVHGFDATKEVVDALSQSNVASPNKFFHWFAIGNEDGERKFFFNPSNPSNSSFFEYPGTQARIVPVRRLDTLLKEGAIPKADFLKVDVEGHERHLFLGASELLAAGVLGIETETSFATSVVYPQAAFGLIQALLIKHGLVMSDLNFNRVRRAAYQKARELRGLPELSLVGAGKPATFNVLFCRDLVAELNGGVYYEKLPPSPRVDQILKLMAIYELHGLNDIAVDIAMTFSNELGRRLDVERAIDLLCDNIDVRSAESAAVPIEESAPEMSLDYVLRLEMEAAALKDQISMIYASTSWRITAPLRTVRKALKRWR
jgi:FkbM family methyltransferase